MHKHSSSVRKPCIIWECALSCADSFLKPAFFCTRAPGRGTAGGPLASVLTFLPGFVLVFSGLIILHQFPVNVLAAFSAEGRYIFPLLVAASGTLSLCKLLLSGRFRHTGLSTNEFQSCREFRAFRLFNSGVSPS